MCVCCVVLCCVACVLSYPFMCLGHQLLSIKFLQALEKIPLFVQYAKRAKVIENERYKSRLIFGKLSSMCWFTNNVENRLTDMLSNGKYPRAEEVQLVPSIQISENWKTDASFSPFAIIAAIAVDLGFYDPDSTPV